jgi:hypothetical protein
MGFETFLCWFKVAEAVYCSAWDNILAAKKKKRLI